MSLTRRKFLKTIAVGSAALGTASIITACSPEEQKEDSESRVEIPETFTDGVYVSQSIGMHGNVVARTEIRNGAIAECQVLNHNESFRIGTTAAEVLPQKIQETQCIDVDGITGATMSSLAIKEAVGLAIDAAGGERNDFLGYTTPEKTTNHIDEDVDVVIMGAGIAGLMTAWELCDQGKNVLVFDKMPFTGGCTPLTSCNLSVAGTKIQLMSDDEDLKEAAADSVDSQIDLFKNFVMDPESPYYNADVPYLGRMFEYASKGVDKMFDQGVPFSCGKYNLFPYFAPGPFNVGGSDVVDIIVDRSTRAGARYITSTEVTKLLIENDTVVGCEAESEDGTTYTVKAKSTVIASGSFIENAEMMKEYNEDWTDLYCHGPKWATGDGMILGKEIGAAYACMDCGVTPHYYAAKSRAEISFLPRYVVPGVVVNGIGERFVNEDGVYKVYLKEFRAQEHQNFYWIFDETGRSYLHKNGNPYNIDYLWILETGDVIEGENVKDLADKIGLPELPETVSNVEDCVLNGTEDEFGRENLPLLEGKGKMYAIEVLSTPYITHGGLDIDPTAHVRREDGTAISGLYAIGDVTGSMECKDGSMYYNGLTQAIGYGMVAAESILEDTK